MSNVITNDLVKELKEFMDSDTLVEQIDANSYKFVGNPLKFSVTMDEGHRPIEFRGCKFYFAVIDEKVLSEESIKYLLNFGFYKSMFKNVSFKNLQLKNDFSQCSFYECYFKNTQFNGSDFTGSTFYHCSFSGSKFEKSILHYTKYNHCDIKYENIVDSYDMLWVSTKILLMREIQKSCKEINNLDEYSLLGEKLKESKFVYLKTQTFFSEKVSEKNDFFGKKVSNLCKLLKLFIEKRLFGYNLKPFTIIRSILVLSLLSILYFFLTFFAVDDFSFASFWSSVELVVALSIGYRSNIPYISELSVVPLYVHSVLLYVFYGMLIASVVSRFSNE